MRQLLPWLILIAALALIAGCKPDEALENARCIKNHDWQEGDPYCDAVAKGRKDI